jgi:hypothetical protein
MTEDPPGFSSIAGLHTQRLYSHPLEDLWCLLVLHENVIDASLKHNEVVWLALATSISKLGLQEGVQRIKHPSSTQT